MSVGGVGDGPDLAAAGGGQTNALAPTASARGTLRGAGGGTVRLEADLQRVEGELARVRQSLEASEEVVATSRETERKLRASYAHAEAELAAARASPPVAASAVAESNLRASYAPAEAKLAVARVSLPAEESAEIEARSGNTPQDGAYEGVAPSGGGRRGRESAEECLLLARAVEAELRAELAQARRDLADADVGSLRSRLEAAEAELSRVDVVRLGPSETRLLRESFNRRSHALEEELHESNEALACCREELGQARRRVRGNCTYWSW